MVSLDTLPSDILLHIVAALSLNDTVSLSMVGKIFYALSQEHSFWLEPLRTARISQSIPCATMDDLIARATEDLKQLALHTVRLDRNWSSPLPQIAGPIKKFRCDRHNSILNNLPGTDLIVLYSMHQGTIICVDGKTDASSEPMFVGRIIDMTSSSEDLTGFTLAALVDDEARSMHTIIVLRATIHPAVATSVVFQRDLDPHYIYSGIFMTSSVVGVVRTLRDASIEAQSFNLLNPKLSTIIVTDQPSPHVLGCTVIGDTVYFIILHLQATDAFVYACPPRLLAYTEPSPEIDYTIRRSHVAQIPRLVDADDPAAPSLTRFNYCVLATEPNYGRNTVSIARNVFAQVGPNGRWSPHSLEITFWPRPVSAPRAAFESDEEFERAEGQLMLPSQTIAIPGSLCDPPGTAWELPFIVADSGLAILLLVDPLPEVLPREDGVNFDEEAHAAPPPKLIMVRYDAVRSSVSLHELRIPAGTDEGDLVLDTRSICSLAIDDHRGVVFVVTEHDVLHYIPYA